MEELHERLKEQRLLKAKILKQQIEKRSNLVAEKESLIEKINYEKRLIVNDIINTFKNEMQSSEFNLIWGIDETSYYTVWLYHQNKNDEEKTKQLFKWITDVIKEKILLNNKHFKLTEIIMTGYNRQSYRFEYKYKKHKFGVEIPMFNTTNNENYKEMLLGYKIYHYTSEYTLELIISNLDYNQLANEFKQYIDSLEIKNEKED